MEYGALILRDGMNSEAMRTIPALRRAGARIILTAHRPLPDNLEVRRALLESEDGVRLGRLLRDVPRRFTGALEAAHVQDAFRDCAIIGADPYTDVPAKPVGIVTAISGDGISFGKVLAYLRSLIHLGEGDFAKGFDSLAGFVRRRHNRAVSIVDDGRYNFNDDAPGLSRVLVFQ
ncbi:MAG: hypothetical protein AB1529_05485 [Candidatus Micrarchaeota archaeon]